MVFFTDYIFLLVTFKTINEPRCFLEESSSDHFDFTRRTVRFLLVTVLRISIFVVAIKTIYRFHLYDTVVYLVRETHLLRTLFINEMDYVSVCFISLSLSSGIFFLFFRSSFPTAIIS